MVQAYMLWSVLTEAQRVERSDVAEDAAMFNHNDARLKRPPGTISKTLHSTLRPPLISAQHSTRRNKCCHGMTQPEPKPCNKHACCTHASILSTDVTNTARRLRDRRL